jgi:tetratricopeptide (TPR) repeat protein
MASSPADYASIRRREFISIVTSDYADHRFPPLRKVVEEAATIKAWLCSPALQERHFEQVHPELGLNPSEDQIRLAFKGRRPDKDWQESTAAVIYMTGHGVTHDDQHWLVLKDTDSRALRNTAMATSEIVGWLKETGPRHLLLVLDTCYAGELGKGMASFEKEIPKTWLVLPSATKNQTAQTCALSDAIEELLKELNSPEGERYGHEPFLTVEFFLEQIEEKLGDEQRVVPLGEGQFYGPHPCLPNPRYRGPAGAPTAGARRDLALPRADLEAHWGPRARGVVRQREPGWLFSGRAALMRRLIEAATGEPGVLLVTGGAGSGKSAVLARLVTLSDPEFCRHYADQVAAIPDDLKPPPEAVDVAVLATGKTAPEILAQICQAVGALEPAGTPPVLTDASAAWQAWLSGREAPVTIVVDALDEAAKPGEVLGALQLLEPSGTTPPKVRLIVGVRSTSGDQPDVVPAGRGHGQIADLAQQQLGADPEQGRIRVDESPWWDRNDVRAYVASLLRVPEHSPYRGEDALTEEVAGLIADAAGTSFLVAKIAGEQLAARDRVVDPQDAAWRTSISSGVLGVFRADLHTALPNPEDRERAVHLLRAVAFGHGRGLPWASIWPLVANAICDEPGRYGDSDIRWLVESRLGGYLVTDQEDAVTVYRLFHHDLQTILRERWLDLLEADTAPAADAPDGDTAVGHREPAHHPPAVRLYWAQVDLERWRQENAVDGALRGLGDWVEEWGQRVTDGRCDAPEQLIPSPFPYPPGFLRFVERFVVALAALGQRDWSAAQPLLRIAAAGLWQTGDREAPSARTRAALLLLLARIGVAAGEDPSADLEAARQLGAGPADTEVVRAWYARRQNQSAEAAAYLAEARRDGFSVAILAETVAQARIASVQDGLASARRELAELTSIAGLSGRLDMLVQPIAPELWLAAAERATAEGDSPVAAVGLDRCEHGTDDDELRALACEQRAVLLAASGAEPKAQAETLTRAGGNRWAAGQLDLAGECFQRAAELCPDQLTAALGLSAVQTQAWVDDPGAATIPRLTAAVVGLDKLQAEHGLDRGQIWSLLLTADLRMRLAAAADPGADHAWRAALATGRALILDPGDSDSWIQLVGALSFLGYHYCAAFAAQRTEAVDGGRRPDDVISTLITTAANLGDLETAGALLPEDNDHSPPLLRAVAGLVRYRQGSVAEAARLLRLAVAADPDLSWARQYLMRACLLAGDAEGARREAGDLRSYLHGRRDPDALGSLGDAALILGDLTEAERIGSDLARRESQDVDRGEGLAIVGMAKLLTGRVQGLDDLAGSLQRARTPRYLDDWENAGRLVLATLARKQKVELPSLAPLEDVIAQRRAVLAAWAADPLAELAGAPAGPGALTVISQARALLTVLVQEVRTDPARARAALGAATPAGRPVPEWSALAERILGRAVVDSLNRLDLGPAAAAEIDRMAGPSHVGSFGQLPQIVQMLYRTGHQEDAEQVISAARRRLGDLPDLTRADGDLCWYRGQRAEAVSAWKAARTAGAVRTEVRLALATAGSDRKAAVRFLGTAMAQSCRETAMDLIALGMDEADISAIGAVLGDAGSIPDLAAGVAVTAHMLGADDILGIPTWIELYLPASWFDGLADPHADHPLFTRYLPELQIRLQWQPLPIRLRTDDPSLGPNDYRICVFGLLVDEGALQADAGYVFEAEMPLLSPALQGRATGRRVANFIELRAGTGTAAGLDGLLLMSAGEAVCRRIEMVATPFRSILEQPAV